MTLKNQLIDILLAAPQLPIFYLTKELIQRSECQECTEIKNDEKFQEMLNNYIDIKMNK
jgi:hypothetical protein